MSLKEQKQKNDKKEKHISENHKIVSQSEWMEARKDLLAKEKEFTILRDQLNQKRQIYHGFKLIKSMSLMGQMENKLCQNFLMEEVS